MWVVYSLGAHYCTSKIKLSICSSSLLSVLIDTRGKKMVRNALIARKMHENVIERKGQASDTLCCCCFFSFDRVGKSFNLAMVRHVFLYFLIIIFFCFSFLKMQSVHWKLSFQIVRRWKQPPTKCSGCFRFISSRFEWFGCWLLLVFKIVFNRPVSWSSIWLDLWSQFIVW